MTRDELIDLAALSERYTESVELTTSDVVAFDRKLGDLTRAIAEAYRARAVYIRSRLDEK